MSMYCTVKQLRDFSMSQALFNTMDQAGLIPLIGAASDFADSYLQSKFQLPLISYGLDLSMMVAHIATFYALIKRGMNPEGQEDLLIQKRYNHAESWLMKIADEKITPTFIDSSGTGDDGQGLFVTSAPSRGFTVSGFKQIVSNQVINQFGFGEDEIG